MYGEQYLIPVNGGGAYFPVDYRIPDVRYDNGVPRIGKVHYDPHTDTAYARDQYGNLHLENTRRGSVVIGAQPPFIGGTVSTSVTYPVGHSGYTDAYGRQVRTRPETPPRRKSKKVVYVESVSDEEEEVEVVYVDRRTGKQISKNQVDVSVPRSSLTSGSRIHSSEGSMVTSVSRKPMATSVCGSRFHSSGGPMVTANGQLVEYFPAKITCGKETRWVGCGYTCREDQAGRRLIISWNADNGERCSQTLPY